MLAQELVICGGEYFTVRPQKGHDLRPGWRVVALFGCEIVVVRRRQWTPEAKAGQMAEVEFLGGARADTLL